MMGTGDALRWVGSEGAVAQHAYDADSLRLHVEFRSGLAESYHGVPPHIAAGRVPGAAPVGQPVLFLG